MITVHPQGDMNVCSKCHDNPFNNCGDISLKTINVNIMVELKERSADHHVRGNINVVVTNQHCHPRDS